MSKNNKAALIIISLLAVAFIVALSLGRDSTNKRMDLLAEAKIELVTSEESIEVDLSDIEEVGAENFIGIFDSSTTGKSEHEYIGIEIRDLLGYKSIDLEDKKAVIVHGADGFSVAYSMDEILNENNIYLVYMEDGTYLGGRESGGRGPYETIILSDTFSNRRCKWVVKIEVVE